jgi:hypothetical protein
MEIRQRACLGVKRMLVALNIGNLRDAKSGRNEGASFDELSHHKLPLFVNINMRILIWTCHRSMQGRLKTSQKTNPAIESLRRAQTTQKMNRHLMRSGIHGSFVERTFTRADSINRTYQRNATYTYMYPVSPY